jgi:crotonobetainyl-CoA:carnitine CoA-transferase CaiB-like acyl-CoA transferase
MSAAEIGATFEAHGLPFAPITRPENLFDDPHLNASGGLAEMTLPDGERAGERTRAPLLPLLLDGQRHGIRLAPPRVGEHTDELLSSLGYDAAQIAALKAAQITR